jgi:hypothetical protein
MDSHCRGLECRPGSDSPGRGALVPRDGPVRGDFREATRLRPGLALDMGQITDHVVAYRDGQVSLEALCAYLASFPYKSCPRFGIWQMWAGPHALDDTTQEMLMVTAQLPNDDYLAIIRAIKNRPVPVHELGDDDGRDGGPPTAE